MTSQIHFADTQYGFDWGAVKVIRGFSDKEKGWVWLLLETPKHQGRNSLQIRVTKSGKIRIADANGEWTRAKEAKP